MIVKELFAYNWQCRRKLLKSMAEMPWETVTENVGASFDCIRNIFIHSLQAELFWVRLLSKKSPAGIWDVPFSKYASVKDMEEYTDEVESETNEYLKGLTDAKLKGVLEFTGWDKKTHRHKVEDVLLHVVEEEIHHRGELLCILWQHDIQPPYVSYIGYKGEA
jgi:uncharacterized damage-inducible protein DinB